MARTDAQKLAVAGFARFGLGARPGDLAAVGEDIRGAILAEIAPQAVVMPKGEEVLASAEAFRRFRAEAQKVKALRADAAKMASAAASPESGQNAEGTVSAAAGTNPKSTQPVRQVVQSIFRAEARARLDAAMSARVGFAERMVLFWSNHFCVSARKGGAVRVLAGPYEREAIRPHVFGRFADMLMAAERHPAMLVYLDNEQSVGPNSVGGQRQHRGLNENLAREILELHTLGVDGGYDQDDVSSLARILTGWRFARQDSPRAEEGTFVFNPNLHEPGDHKVMGVVYRDEGLSQGERALDALAKHPATARHIARKLAVHFVSDTPNPVLVAKLEKAFLQTGGDLAAVSRALVEAPEAWAEPPTKLRLPYEFLAAAVRATGLSLQPPQINGALRGLGQPLWAPPGPNGFSDATDAWLSPEGVKTRLDFAARFAELVPATQSPSEVLEDVLGPAAGEHTRVAVAHAESRQQAFALLFMSAEFQRR